MHGSTEIASAGTMWLAAILFVITYAVVMSEKINRAIVSLVAAGLMIMLGILNQAAAIRGVDFNTIGLLIGMMVIVAITRQSGIFQFLAIWSAKKVNANPWGILEMCIRDRICPLPSGVSTAMPRRASAPIPCPLLHACICRSRRRCARAGCW